jgi:hypothetical protein
MPRARFLPRLARTLLPLAAATLAACSASLTTTGPGSLVEEKVAEALLAPWPGGTARPVGPMDPMEGATRNWDPARGRLAFVVQRGSFVGPETCIEISISPWDEDPQTVRRIEVDAWHWNLFPPMTRGPVPSLRDEAVERIRRALRDS